MWKRISEYLTDGIQWTSGVLFLGLLVLNVLRIFLRYFFGISWLWVPDLSRLLFIWIVFLGSACLYGGGEHLVMDYFISKLDYGIASKLRRFVLAGECVLFIVLMGVGIQMTIVRMGIPFDTWDLPTGYAYLAVPISGAIMMFFCLVNGMQLFGKEKNI
ncbi:MAG: TRAP transporter small permease [Spirochaetes bacterium]|nr:TRAP transporter small permease [Spirochaetota bacterium]